MKCIKCGTTNGILHRTAPKGESPANWMCISCIENTEPELSRNIKEDMLESPIFKDLENICNPKHE